MQLTSEWAKTHPTDAQILSEELEMEESERERQKVSCINCYHFVCDYPALVSGWGLCLANTDDDEAYFCQEWDTCGAFEPWEEPL